MSSLYQCVGEQTHSPLLCTWTEAHPCSHIHNTINAIVVNQKAWLNTPAELFAQDSWEQNIPWLNLSPAFLPWYGLPRCLNYDYNCFLLFLPWPLVYIYCWSLSKTLALSLQNDPCLYFLLIPQAYTRYSVPWQRRHCQKWSQCIRRDDICVELRAAL